MSAPSLQIDSPIKIRDVQCTVVGAPWRELTFVERLTKLFEFMDDVVGAFGDAVRAIDHGFRSVLISDVGVLSAFDVMRGRADLPRDMQAKISVMLPVANAATAQVLERLGANTLNVATDVTLAELAAIRAGIDIPFDIYVESPDNLGGFVRHNEIPDLIRVCTPCYLKFGVRNARDL